MIVDIDILDIDSKIIRSFDDDKCKIDDYNNRKMELEESLKLNSLTQRTIKSIQESIKELSDHIDDIRSSRTYNYYIIESAEILEKYKKSVEEKLRKVKNLMPDTNISIYALRLEEAEILIPKRNKSLMPWRRCRISS